MTANVSSLLTSLQDSGAGKALGGVVEGAQNTASNYTSGVVPQAARTSLAESLSNAFGTRPNSEYMMAGGTPGSLGGQHFGAMLTQLLANRSPLTSQVMPQFASWLTGGSPSTGFGASPPPLTFGGGASPRGEGSHGWLSALIGGHAAKG